MTSTNKLLSTDNPNLDNLILQRKEEKISTELDNETVILDMESGVYSGLDAVGTSIWKLLEQEINFAFLCHTLMEEYEVNNDLCRKDTLFFLQELDRNKLITIKE